MNTSSAPMLVPLISMLRLSGLTLMAVAGLVTPSLSQARVDLSGTYDVATLTPLDRPRQLGDKATLTAAEAAQIAKRFKDAIEADAQPSDPDRDAPPEGGTEFLIPEFSGAAGGVGGYNAFYVDFGESNFQLDGEYRTSIVTSPTNGRRPALSPQGMAKVGELRANFNENTGTAWWLERGVGPYDNPENRPLGERCILGFGSTAGPPALPVLYNNLKRIVQTDDFVLIVNEMNHDARIIPINGPALPTHMRGWMGYSTGQWEGDTLVVTTQGFREQPAMTMASADLQVEERFSRIDKDTLRYQFTVTDTNWSEPWSGEYPWPSTQEKMYEYACHEGNYALGGILRGARLLESEAGQAAGGH